MILPVRLDFETVELKKLYGFWNYYGFWYAEELLSKKKNKKNKIWPIIFKKKIIVTGVPVNVSISWLESLLKLKFYFFILKYSKFLRRKLTLNYLEFFFFFKQIFFKVDSIFITKFFFIVRNCFYDMNFSDLAKFTTYLFLVHERQDHKQIIRFLELVGSFYEKLNFKGYFLLVKGKLSWKALSRKKKKRVLRGNTSRTNLSLVVSGDRGGIRIITGAIGVQFFFFSFFVLFL